MSVNLFINKLWSAIMEAHCTNNIFLFSDITNMDLGKFLFNQEHS
jgi:hypothetical protein